jgi:hypothetical protein
MGATKAKAPARKPARKDQTRKQAHGPEKKQRDVTATPSKASDRHYKENPDRH